MKTLNRNIDEFSFVQREIGIDGKLVKNRCGRDFIYYALNYYYPESYNGNALNAVQLEKNKVLGPRVPEWLMWTGLQFLYLPKLLSSLKLKLTINNRDINSFFSFILALFIPNISNVENKIKEIEQSVDRGYATGVDISLGMGGLLDHVMFVYGYDESNFYVFDSHQAPDLEYEKALDSDRYYMKLPKSIVIKRWSKFGRVWIVRSDK